MADHCVTWDELPEAVFETGIARRVLQGDAVSLVMVRVPAGTNAARHSHPHEQFVQVLSGSGILETSQGTHRFGAGSVFHFPPDTWHAASFDTDTVLVETNVASGE